MYEISNQFLRTSDVDLFSVSFAIDSALNVSSAAQEVALAGAKGMAKRIKRGNFLRERREEHHFV